jgi:DNA-binding response OmpR family regulator/HPt (histidine-containing phosphotransfer) domain-containing protein
MRILLVEDDRFTGSALVDNLTAHQYLVDLATDGETGLQLVRELNYDLVMLDVMLPKLDGISVCQRLRAQGYESSILLLTAKDSSSDRVLGLDAGADDYVVKPFDLPELMARIRALLRRGRGISTSAIVWENICFDPVSTEVTCDGRSIHLTPKEYSLLELFLRHPKRIFSRSNILDRLWDMAESPGEETVSSHIYSVRQKLKATGAIDPIETVHGLGYRLKTPSLAPESADAAPRQERRKRSERQSHIVRLAKTWEKFKPKFISQIATLENTVNCWIAGNLIPEQQQVAEQTAHKLVGSLGLLGWREGSHLARQIELLFQQEEIEETAQVQWAIDRICALRQGIDRIDGTTPADHTIPDAPLLSIVDDDLMLAEEIGREATIWGMRVQIATDPNGAREAITETPPDIILLDLNFPDAPEDGLTFLRELGQQFPRIPVLVFTVRESLSDRVEVVRLGGSAFLHKPLSTHQILQAVSETLSQTHRPPANRVMVVGCDRAFLANLKQLLQPWGVEVSTLENPQQFWEVLQTTMPDLLVVGGELPDFSSIDLCQVVRHDPQWKDLPILVVTEQMDMTLMQAVFAAGANDSIHKSASNPDLVNRIISRLPKTRSSSTITSAN